MRILFLLTKQFRQLLEVKEMTAKGYARNEIGAKVGMPPYVVGKHQDQAKAFSTRMLRNILEESAEIEESVKTGNLTDRLGVELFLIKHSSQEKK